MDDEMPPNWVWADVRPVLETYFDGFSDKFTRSKLERLVSESFGGKELTRF